MRCWTRWSRLRLKAEDDRRGDFWSSVPGSQYSPIVSTADRKTLFAVIPLMLYWDPETPDTERQAGLSNVHV